MFQVSNVNKHFGMRKVVGFAGINSYIDNTWRLFRAAASNNMSAAYVQLEFGESAASVRVRLLIKYDFMVECSNT